MAELFTLVVARSSPDGDPEFGRSGGATAGVLMTQMVVDEARNPGSDDMTIILAIERSNRRFSLGRSKL